MVHRLSAMSKASLSSQTALISHTGEREGSWWRVSSHACRQTLGQLTMHSSSLAVRVRERLSVASSRSSQVPLLIQCYSRRPCRAPRPLPPPYVNQGGEMRRVRRRGMQPFDAWRLQCSPLLAPRRCAGLRLHLLRLPPEMRHCWGGDSIAAPAASAQDE